MRHFLAIMFWATCSYAQVVVGVKAGVPFNDALKLRDQIATRSLETSTMPFTVGPTLEVRLPGGFAAELDALWKRYDQKLQTETISDQSWEFPLLAKWRLPGLGIRPYLEAGISHQRLGSVVTSLRAIGRLDTAEITSELRRGGVFGAGLEIGTGRTRLSLGGRYARWQSTSLIPSANNIDMLLGLTF